MAKGGDASPYCSESRAHQKGCEYFAEGGAVDPNDVIPDAPSTYEPSDLAPKEWQTGSQAIPADQVIPDEPVANAISPDDVIPDNPVVIDPADVIPDPDKDYSSPDQKGLAVMEGMARGIGGPVATWAEKKFGELEPDTQKLLGTLTPGLGPIMLQASKLGVTPADIAGRADANPEAGLAEGVTAVGSLFVPGGQANVVAKMAEGAAQLAKLGKVGSGILKGALTNGLIQGGDEVSTWLLGQGNQEEATGAALTNMAAQGLFGAVTGGIGAKLSNPLSKVSTVENVGHKAESFLAGIAMARGGNIGREIVHEGGENLLALEYDQKAFKAGVKFFDTTVKKAINYASSTVGGSIGAHGGGILESLYGVVVGNVLGRTVGGAVNKVSKKVVAPATMKFLMSESAEGFFEALNHAQHVEKGAQALAKGVEGLFNAAGLTEQQLTKDHDFEKDRKWLGDYITKGGVPQEIQKQLYLHSETPQGFAEGGAVKAKEPEGLFAKNGVAIHYPEQNMLLNVAKGRISGYLSSLKPNANTPKLAFDDGPDLREKTKTYHRALDIANKPLSVLKEIKHGTIEPEHIKHLQQMYPEVLTLMQKKATAQIVKSQLDGKKPSYKIRQGLSLLMGTALSVEMTPSNIQAAQAVFQRKNPEEKKSSPKKSDTSSLTKSDDAYLTSSQVRTARQQRV